MSLPETREEAEALCRAFVEMNASHGGVALPMAHARFLALARLGLEAAFPTEETRTLVAKAIYLSIGYDEWECDSNDDCRPDFMRHADAALSALVQGENELVLRGQMDEARAALTAAKPAIRDAWLAGFAASCEGWNGEYPPDAVKRVESDADDYAAAMLSASPAVE